MKHLQINLELSNEQQDIIETVFEDYTIIANNDDSQSAYTSTLENSDSIIDDLCKSEEFTIAEAFIIFADHLKNLEG